MKITAPVIQDLYHYALAVQGNGNSTFDHSTLMQRLDAAERIYEKLTCLDADQHDVESWTEMAEEPRRWKTTDEMTAYGKRVQDKVCEYALFCGIDPNTGEKLESEPERRAAMESTNEEAEFERLCERGDMRHDEER